MTTASETPPADVRPRQRLTMLASKERATDLEALRPFLENGQVTPVIDRTYTLAEVPAAMRHLEAGLAKGKIAIAVQLDSTGDGTPKTKVHS